MSDEKHKTGMAVRREVLGDAHVNLAEANKTDFDADFQYFITEVAWGSVWSRPGLDRTTRHLLTIGLLAALGKEAELALHIRATQNTGVTPDQVKEAILQVAVYAGVPAANSAIATAKKVYEELSRESDEQEANVIKPKRTGVMDRRIHPPHLHPDYAATIKRAPGRPLVPLPSTLCELTGPVYGMESIQPLDNDLTRNAVQSGEPIGERIIVSGRVLDESGRPVPGALVEVWQANAGGRYIHINDRHDAPLDPNFKGAGRILTDAEGKYQFTSIKPGAYPWRNHDNAWRPPHIHFSIFGANFLSRLVTQMYFPGDPLLAQDPIYNSIPDEKGRQRLIAAYASDISKPGWALGYHFDIVLAGDRQTPFE